MLHRRTRTTVALTLSLVGTLTTLAAVACGDGRLATDARHTLGTRLGSTPRTTLAATPIGRAAASADDLSAARRYLEATLRLDPNNDAARAALLGLGGLAPDDDLASTAFAALPGPLALRAPAERRATFTEVAFGEVGAIGADVAHAIAPWTVVPSVHVSITREASDSVQSIAELAGVRPPADSVARGDSLARVRRTHRRAVARRRHVQDATRVLAAQQDSTEALPREDGSTGSTAAARPKHKRTWPWTRAQRWLVAKGVGGGAGAGVVVGAIVGNVPGALLAGSLSGGALGFKKATKIGPAAPFPSPRDSATFAQEKRARDAEARPDERRARADSAAGIAVAPR